MRDIHALALYFVFYNFTRIHKTLKMSPAIADGITDTLWSLDDVISKIDEMAPEPIKRGPYKKKISNWDTTHFSVELGRAAFDVSVVGTEIFDMWMELGLEFMTIIGSDFSYAEGELIVYVIDNVDRVGLGMLFENLEGTRVFPVSTYGTEFRLWFKEDLGLVVVTKEWRWEPNPQNPHRVASGWSKTSAVQPGGTSPPKTRSGSFWKVCAARTR